MVWWIIDQIDKKCLFFKQRRALCPMDPKHTVIEGCLRQFSEQKEVQAKFADTYQLEVCNPFLSDVYHFIWLS